MSALRHALVHGVGGGGHQRRTVPSARRVADRPVGGRRRTFTSCGSGVAGERGRVVDRGRERALRARSGAMPAKAIGLPRRVDGDEDGRPARQRSSRPSRGANWSRTKPSALSESICLQGEPGAAQRVAGPGQLGVDLVQQIVPHAHQADGGRGDDAERQQRHVGQPSACRAGSGCHGAARRPVRSCEPVSDAPAGGDHAAVPGRPACAADS